MLVCYVLGEFGFPNLYDKRLCIECFDLKCIKAFDIVQSVHRVCYGVFDQGSVTIREFHFDNSF